MELACLPPVRSYHPTTFLERGVAVPFTTPFLAGTRARPTERQELELVIPNPSGGDGVYVMPWTSIAAICRPTLHDRRLNERIANQNNVTPATIRRISREVAAEGLAGEEAMEAALASADHDKDDRMVANYTLLMALVEQTNFLRAAEHGPPDIEKAARLAVATIAPRLGRSAAWVATALEALANALANIGVQEAGASSRIPRLVALLQQVRLDVAQWSQVNALDDQAVYAETIGSVADFTLTLADSAIRRVRTVAQDVVGLLRSWAASPDSILALTGRPEWLLDGWEQICLIWQCARDDTARAAALVEIMQLVPVLPREVREWTELGVDTELPTRARSLIRLNMDWRTGTKVFDLIARNEHIRAIAC